MNTKAPNTTPLATKLIEELTGKNAADTPIPLPNWPQILDDVAFARLNVVSRFWAQQDVPDITRLAHNVADLLAGWHGQNRAWVFLVQSTGTDFACWFGVKSAGGKELKSMLRGAFPGVSIGDETFDDQPLKKLAHVITLTGIPTAKLTSGDQIEKLCRTLPRTPWAYFISAFPADTAKISKETAKTAENISSLRDQYFTPGNVSAELAASLLNVQMSRWEQGRLVGVWDTSVYFLAAESQVADQAGSVLRGAFSGEQSQPLPIRTLSCGNAANPESTSSPALSRLLTSFEAALLARPPSEELPGYEVIESVRFGIAVDDRSYQGWPSLQLGKIMETAGPVVGRLSFPLQELTKHALIAGVTGSGKTNTCIRLLSEVWDSHRIPFLVIEPAKAEYRRLLADPKLKGSLRVFTVGDETISPLRLNPLEVPAGGSVQTHIDYLKSLFSAVFILQPPLNYMLEAALYEVYEERGWDLALNTNSRGAGEARSYPSLYDLEVKAREVIARMKYSAEWSNDVEGALLARLRSLRVGGSKGALFDTRLSVSSEVLFETPCVLELEKIISDEEKAFLIGIILVRLYEHRQIAASQAREETLRSGVPGKNSQMPGLGLRHLTLVEEAHRLLRNVSTQQGSEVAANPQGKAIEVFASMLAEIRAYGEGILVAEQIPSKLIPDALKNTNLKVIHRLVAADDRESLGQAMSMDASQTKYLARLTTGQAVVYAESVRKPLLVRVDRAAVHQEDVSENAVRGSTVTLREELDIFAPRNRTRICDPRVEKLLAPAFTRVFNAMRRQPFVAGLFHNAWEDFKNLCRQSETGNADIAIPYAIELLEVELEMRAAFWGLSHRFVELAFQMGAEHLEKFSETLDPDPLAEFAEHLHYFYKELPFPGCEACPQPCHYRFDISTQMRALAAGDLQNISELAEREVPMERLALLRHHMKKSYFAFDEESVNGASFCFYVHLLSERGIFWKDQRDLAQECANWLKEEGQENIPEVTS